MQCDKGVLAYLKRLIKEPDSLSKIEEEHLL